MLFCSVCEGKDIKITYHGPIRIGLGKERTKKEYDVYQCSTCGICWHENDIFVPEEYYESAQYRMELEGSTDIEYFYAKHDKDCLNKFIYIGNVFAWLKEGKPMGNVSYPCISATINEAWRANLAEQGCGDYLVVYATK